MQPLTHTHVFDYFVKNLAIYSSTEPKGIFFYGEIKNTPNNSTAKIYIPDYSSEILNCDVAGVKPQFIHYRDSTIPIIGPFEPDKNTFYKENHAIYFSFDIISNLFFWLSGWHELFLPKDKLGRSTFHNSLQKKWNIAFTPVADVLWRMIADAYLQATNQKLFDTPLFGQNTCSVALTHDVDYWQTLWRKELKYCFTHLQPLKFIKTLYSRNHFYTFFGLKKWLNIRSAKSTFFFMANHHTHETYLNADYPISKSPYKKELKNWKKNGSIGLHGALICCNNAEKLSAQKVNLEKIIEKEIKYQRFHYLHYYTDLTPSILVESNIKIDSTLGWNDFPGPRYGTFKPFYLFDFKNNTITNVLELPLIIMDATLFYPHYLGYKKADEALAFLLPLLQNCVTYGGILTLNWHNDAFELTAKKEWVKLLDMIMDFCQNHKTDYYSFEQLFSTLNV